MGNEAVSSTINWSDLSKSAKKCDISNAKDILSRLNIDFPDPENKQNDNDKKENEYNDLAKYLEEYLNKISDDEMKALFLRFGVNPDIDEKADKICALMLIASKHYWRKNWSFHPLQKRVKNWIFVHNKYRESMDEIINSAESNLDSAKALLIKFDKKISAHSDFEDNMLFKYLKENVDDSIISKNILNQLSNDHSQQIPGLTEKLISCTDLVEFEKLIKEYKEETLQHLQKEEENIIHVWLNLNEDQYKKYRQYLSWKYAAVY